jgi:hypothetical protein
MGRSARIDNLQLVLLPFDKVESRWSNNCDTIKLCTVFINIDVLRHGRVNSMNFPTRRICANHWRDGGTKGY